MTDIKKQKTFLVECERCEARVAALQTGSAEHVGWDEHSEEPYGQKICVGTCPHCNSLLASFQAQIGFENYDSEYDRWSDPVRIYPNPAKTFSRRIPKVVRASVAEAQLCIQAGAHIASCVMLGRTIEALCADIIGTRHKEAVSAAKAAGEPAPKPMKRIMLGAGIKELHSLKVIDDRLYDWSQQIQQFRNVAAHAVDVTITRQDAADLLTFVTALVEYVYDLTERYEEFLARAARSKSLPEVEAD